MWAITNQTRFKAERTFSIDRDGAEIWIVGVRTTFSIGSRGELALAEEQQDVCLAPVFFGDPGGSSLRYDSDLVRIKLGTDVILHAHAYAPNGRAAQVVDASITVGPLSKRLRVFGDRVWRHGWSDLEPSEPQPFVSQPITYERAWGGRTLFNTAGIGVDASAGKAVPNVEYPDNPIRSPRHSGPPAGIGPIPCHWQPRLKLAGTYDEAWQRERRPLVPNDFDDRYFQCAPVDQQIGGFLRGGEEVVLQNLTPEGSLRFALPTVSLGFSTRIEGRTEHHRGHLYTVIIEPDDHRLIMVWQTALPCHHTLYSLRETVVYEKERTPLGSRTPEAELVA